MTIQEKAKAFRALHTGTDAFIMPNPHDAGSAVILEKIGFKALATSSAGFAFTTGQTDYGVTRESVVDHIAALTAVTDLPVSADLENGFFDSADEVAETIRQAAGAGAVGGSIEDSASAEYGSALYDIDYAKERIAAAVEAKKALGFDFTLTARAENYSVGQPDLAEVIARLQAYQEAGADVLFAPGVIKAEDVRSVLENIDKPLSVMIGSPAVKVSVSELSGLGVKRVSVGPFLTIAALGAFVKAGRELMETGGITFAEDALGYGDIDAMFTA